MYENGALGRTRTDNIPILSGATLPIGLQGHVNGAAGGTRTHNTWFLRPVTLPLAYSGIKMVGPRNFEILASTVSR